MSTETVTPPFAAPTPTEIRDNILRTTRNGLIARGVPNPNVSENSDHWVRATALSNELAPVYANQIVRCDQMMPDTSTGADLGRWLGFFGDGFQPAGPSSGNIVYSTSSTGLVSAGTQLIDSAGNTFQVVTGGVYADGASIPVKGVSVGTSTNHLAGDVLQWVSPPAYAAATALVATGGLIDGTDADDDDTARARLFSRLRTPASVGNPSQIIAWAADGSTAVLGAYCYPALDGPSTDGVCVVGALVYGSVTSFSRAISGSALADVAAYVAGKMPPRVRVTCKSVDDISADVAIGVSLPLPQAAGGAGNGWLDSTPWPVLNGSATYCKVQTVTDSTHLTLTSGDTGTTPSAVGIVSGSTRVSWFSPSEWYAGRPAVQTATIVSHAGTTGAITVVLSSPFIGIKTGDYIFPAAVNGEAYAQAYMAAMAALGPGQWTADTARVPRALRRPFVTQANPSDLTSAVLKAIVSAGDEVADASYLYRNVTTPGVPSDTTGSPRCIVPRRIGFYDSSQ